MSDRCKPYRLLQGTAHLEAPLELECGVSLPDVSIRYTVYGEPNEAADNVTLICHALSGSSRPDQWWPTLLDQVFDFERDCVICTNVLGSCYGSTGPTSINPAIGEAYGANFPQVTVRDMVRAQKLALEQLGFSHFSSVIGSSLGGMQALQWAIDYPEAVDRCIAVGCAPLSAMGLALNHLQRQAVAVGAATNQEVDGLALARAIGMISYKSAELFTARHGRHPNRIGPEPWCDPTGRFDIGGYLDHQGQVFVDRFDPNSYVTITRTIDLFDPAREYGTAERAYSRIRANVLLVGISSDWLFPAADIKALAETISNAGAKCSYHEIVSDHGHDAFLAEPETLTPAVLTFLNKTAPTVIAAPCAAAQGAECR